MANILVPFDFSPNAVAALDQALLIAKGKGFSIEVLHILNLKAAQDYPADWQIDAHHIDQGMVETQLSEIVEDRCRLFCAQPYPPVITTLRESVMINGGIINHMLENKADLIVMGTHGATNAIERFWGSNTSTMINHSLFPILAVPPHWQPVELDSLLAAISLKEAAAAVPKLIQWANWLQVKAEMISLSSIPAADQQELDAVMEAFPGLTAHLTPKLNDLPMWKSLVNFSADRKRSVLLMFVHERTVLEKLFNYSITSKVADGIRIPLLAVPMVKHS